MSSYKRKIQNRIEKSFLTIPAYFALEGWYGLRYMFYRYIPLPAEDQHLVEKNVTFIYKSFNRQRKAKLLYHSIRSFFPRVRIILQMIVQCHWRFPVQRLFFYPLTVT